MKRERFNDGWKVQAKAGVMAGLTGEKPASMPVTLPHDLMISRKRSADVPGGRNKAYFPDGQYEYIKTFTLGEAYRGRYVVFEFEGVYMNAVVFINGEYAGQQPYGYSNFYIDADAFLRPGAENTIKVGIETGEDSRWYSGAGIYRNVNIISGGETRFALNGVRVTTAALDNNLAVIEIQNTVESQSRFPFPARILTEIYDDNGILTAKDTVPLTVFAGNTVARERIAVVKPRPWDTETPRLYTCRSSLLDESGAVLDTEENVFGIRILGLNTIQGFTINGKTVKLRGACIHHDNGVIGAATFERAEERRAELLKKAGFNALRSAHHPMSKALLDACDRLGLLVMDEAFDMWTMSKTNSDYSKYFPEWWERDLTAMVDKDYNHPCVVFYSIGNEIPDTGKRSGSRRGRCLAEKIRSLDASRYTINSINGLFSAMEQLAATAEPTDTQAKEINSQMADMGDMMKQVMNSEIVTKATEESFACVDAAGYNYMDTRYLPDGEHYPHRVICGSETYARDIASNWALVEKLHYLIGDFTWTGWDYLGEAGIGKIAYGERTLMMLAGEFPWITAWCGDLDITGARRPVSYYREIVWGLRKVPYIATQDPERYGEPKAASPWAWSDVVESWTWPGHEGKPVRVEIYSDADEVFLYLNGDLIGKTQAGRENKFMAVFDTVYRNGTLEAVSYNNGKETGRTTLTTAGEPAALKLSVDRDMVKAGVGDLAYVSVSLVDLSGNTNPAVARQITVTVEGSGVLQGFGSANPVNEEDYVSGVHTTFEGRVLAVLRPLNAGTMRLRAEAKDLPPADITVTVE